MLKKGAERFSLVKKRNYSPKLLLVQIEVKGFVVSVFED